MFEIQYRVQGKTLSEKMQSLLSEVIVRRELSAPSFCELVFHGSPDELNKVAESLTIETKLELSSLLDNALFFTGNVTEQNYKMFSPQEAGLKIVAHDVLDDMKRSQSVRSHVQVTVSDIAKDLAGKHGLSLDATETGPMRQRLIQFQQSDFDFLSKQAGNAGLYFQVDGAELQIISLKGFGEVREVVMGKDLHQADFKLNRNIFRKGVKVFAWNALKQESFTVDASKPRSGRSVSAAIKDSSELLLSNYLLESESEAEARVQAVHDYVKNQEIVFTGTVQGDVTLKPGIRLRLKNVATDFEGIYVLTKVRHCFNLNEGFVTMVSTELDEPGINSAGTAMTIADVTNLEDPDALGRIQVSMSAFDDSETSWMSVLVPGAGKNKGLIALPDIGDKVLVLFPGDDPAQGIVLGGLFGTEGMPDSGVDGNTVNRYTFVTPGGQKIQLDDAKNKVRIENGKGSFYEMTPDRVRLHAKAKLLIEAPGNSVVIKGSSIDFDKG